MASPRRGHVVSSCLVRLLGLRFPISPAVVRRLYSLLGNCGHAGFPCAHLLLGALVFGAGLRERPTGISRGDSECAVKLPFMLFICSRCSFPLRICSLLTRLKPPPRGRKVCEERVLSVQDFQTR